MRAQGPAEVLDGRAKGPSRSVPLLLKVEKFLRPREGVTFPKSYSNTPAAEVPQGPALPLPSGAGSPLTHRCLESGTLASVYTCEYMGGGMFTFCLETGTQYSPSLPPSTPLPLPGPPPSLASLYPSSSPLPAGLSLAQGLSLGDGDTRAQARCSRAPSESRMKPSRALPHVS